MAFILTISDQVNVECYGSNTGSFEITATGNNGPCVFSINGGPYVPGNILPTIMSYDNLIADVYIVDAKDSKDNPASITVTITEGAEIEITIEEKDPILCNGTAGRIIIHASGGSGDPYQFYVDGTSYPGGGVDYLLAGDYEIGVEDSIGCYATTSFYFAEPDELVISENLLSHFDDTGLSDGQFEVLATGGTGTYSFIANGITQSSGTFSNLAYGDYSVDVLDENDCKDSILIRIYNLALSIFEEESCHINVDCFGNYTGELGVYATGGTATMSYYYELFLDDEFIEGRTVDTGDIAIFDGLIAGTYSAIVSDDMGASASIFDIIITQPDELVISLTGIIAVECYGTNTGYIEVSATGGTEPYYYSANGGPLQSSNVFENIPGGEYNIQVIDYNECIDYIIVRVEQPDEFVAREIDESHIDASCGLDNGQFEIIAYGGTEPYSFSINEESAQNNGLFTNLAAGLYVVTIVDDNDCELELLITVASERKPLDNGIYIYINKRWKNVLINININDNTLPNLRNVDRDAIYSEMYSKITAQNFIEAINDISNKYDFINYIKYIIIDENNIITEYSYDNDIVNLPYILSCENPDELSVKVNSLSKKQETIKLNPKIKLNDGKINNISELNWYNNVPFAYNIDQNYSVAKVLKNYSSNKNIEYYKIFRFSGFYMPIFYDIQLFNKDSEDKECGNYLFDVDLTEFGIIKERKIRKINRAGSILKLRNSRTNKSIYPMVDEFGYSFVDFMIFKSSFDSKYHLETVENKERLISNVNNDVNVVGEFGQPNDYKNKNNKLFKL